MYKISANILRHQIFFKVVLSILVIYFSVGNVVNAQLQSSYPCYAIASNNFETDSLFQYLPATNIWTNLGGLENVDIKALAINPFDDVLYATSGPVFGTIDIENIAFKSIGLLGPAYKGDYGAIIIQDIVGLAYDTGSQRLFGINRITNQVGNGRPDSPDILVELDCITGRIVEDAFLDSNGNTSDYATIGEVNDGTQPDFLFDAKDLAFDPFTGELLVAQDQASPTYLTSINKMTGKIDFVLMEVPNSDVSGLAFTDFGDLIGTTLINPNYNSDGRLLHINFLAGYANSLGYIDFVNTAFHCLDCYVKKPGCYDTLYLNNANSLRRKYNASNKIEIDFLVDIDTLTLTSANEILLNNNFEVPKTSNFCATINSNVCQ